MWDNKNGCQSCRGCCKFREDEAYFAPLFTKREKERLREEGLPADCFKTHKDHTDVFQIILIRSIKEDGWYVCPYLDEETHLCAIYPVRPIDCRIWPLLLMRNKKKDKVLLSCFHQRICTTTRRMSKEEFDVHVGKLTDWFDKEGFIHHLRQSPGLAWDFESDTFPMRTLHLGD